MNETSARILLHKNSWKLALLILILAAFFRLWGTFDLNEYIEDEATHIPDAIAISNYGTTAYWGWHHPQLSGHIMNATIQIFGNNPVGWRSGNIFFGTASVALLFLIGRLIYPGSAVPLLAASLLAFDPHNIYLSRTTYIEIPVTFFFLLHLYLLLEYTENRRNTLPLAGIACGLTIATKAYFAFAFPLAVGYALFRIKQRNELSRSIIVDFVMSMLLVPIAIYLFSFFKWFGRGHTLIAFFQMKQDGIWALQQLSRFEMQDYAEAGGKSWEWFTKPLFWGHQRLIDKNSGRLLLQCNNIPFRIFAFPSLCFVTVYAWRKRIPQDLVAPLLFAGCFLLILMAKRPIFSYSATVLLPFAYLAIARATTLVAAKSKLENVWYVCFCFTTFIWAAYLFPVTSARLVSLEYYKPLLSMVRYMGNF
jgi:dolichyl-phosphate-mannose--protein O-mannosyl transferase